ncbi:cyclin-dependent kinase 12 isoform X2 [Dicentrarchus labrax]|uniref:cyclin-dependent kinase 12 isoform X2 n=1 Tax=Dicentrarchus labrax TaxID=13489 RepID=UPI0021F51D2F|nr:cyclin-dependent kinase 12 isoform X2 [Dicentrarchus labrax]
MSQSRNSTDTQALLQSMLQRLKLQPGREGQTYLHTTLPITAPSTWGQAGERGASNLQRVNNSPVNGFEFGTNGVPSKQLGISAVDGNIGQGIQQPFHGSEVDSGLISFPTQKDNIDDTGEKRVLGQATQPGITSTGTGQLFPVKSLKHADITSSERTDGERVSFGSSAMTRHTPSDKDAVTSMGQNQDLDRGFTPRVFVWSSKPTDANVDTGSQGDKVLHMGNGGFGDLAQSKGTQIVQTDQNTTNNSSRRKQRPSENRTRRWTQKIKERWRDRPGSFGKKGKEEEGREDQKSMQGTELLAAETLITTSIKEEERTPASLDSSDTSVTPPTHTEDSTSKGRMRSASDFEFGLGSFSLLEEIVTGQEWAKFLNPNLSVTSANQSPSEEHKIPAYPYDSSQSSVNNQWSFRGTEASPVSNFSMAQISPVPLLPVSMDLSEGRQQQIHREADQSEPMEDGQTQSDMQSRDSRLGQRLRPASFVQPADILNNSALKSRAHHNRKRQHQSAERLQTEKISDADRGGSLSSLSPSSSHVMEESGESGCDNVIPLYTLNSPPPPLSPSSFSPFAPAPRGVLKHSISQDSESSVEVVTKRRRVEENRRVRFSESVMTIEPPELDLDATDSEEDSGADEDSVIEQGCEVEQAVIEEVAPAARRPALPAWILALKRRKHR